MDSTLWPRIRFFKPSEFDSPDVKGSSDHMNPKLVFMLDNLRALIDRPLKINSAYRTKAHNTKVGGAPASAHLLGEAVDLGTTSLTKEERARLIGTAIALGFTGIGIAKTFIHLDIRPRRASWRYAGNKHLAITLGQELKYA